MSSTGVKRSRNGVLGGVLAGFAHHFGWSVNGTRIVYTIVSIVSAAFPGILIYILLWLLLPLED